MGSICSLEKFIDFESNTKILLGIDISHLLITTICTFLKRTSRSLFNNCKITAHINDNNRYQHLMHKDTYITFL